MGLTGLRHCDPPGRSANGRATRLTTRVMLRATVSQVAAVWLPIVAARLPHFAWHPFGVGALSFAFLDLPFCLHSRTRLDLPFACTHVLVICSRRHVGTTGSCHHVSDLVLLLGGLHLNQDIRKQIVDALHGDVRLSRLVLVVTKRPTCHQMCLIALSDSTQGLNNEGDQGFWVNILLGLDAQVESVLCVLKPFGCLAQGSWRNLRWT